MKHGFSLFSLVALCLVYSCSQGEGGGVGVVGQPAFNPNPGNPGGDNSLPPNSFRVPVGGFLTGLPNTDHQVMILGLKPATPYTVNVEDFSSLSFGVLAGQGGVLSSQIPLAKVIQFSTSVATSPSVYVTEGGVEGPETVAVFETDPLPADFPPMNVLVSQPAQMSPGYTVFNTTANSTFGAYLVAVNAQGEIVWYQPGNARVATRMLSGNLLLCDFRGNVEEVDMLGNVHHSVHDSLFGLPRFHHECLEMENGNILTLSAEMENIGPYPPNGDFYNVVGDLIFEFTWDGQIVNQLSILNILDPFRVIPGFNGSGWDTQFGVPTKDWTHGNAVIRDSQDNSYIASFRHQDVVAKFSYEGELIWVIGQDDPNTTGDDQWPFLQMIGSGQYPNHQHAPEIMPNGDILMYDNSNSTGRSRPVMFRIDEENLTITQIWEYYDETRNPPVCAPFVGDANYLPNGNVLIDHAGMTLPGQACSNGNRQILIVEVNPATNEKVFEFEVRDPAGSSINGYRAVRLPSLYPEQSNPIE